MLIVPKQQSLEAFHFKEANDFADLLRFLKRDARGEIDDGGRIDGNLRIDGYDFHARVSIENATIKVNRYEWLIRTESGLYKTISNTEFENSYQQA